MASNKQGLVATLVVMLAVIATGCTNRNKGKQGPAAPPPPKVAATRPKVTRVKDFREYTGRTAAVESVEVRARVSGYLQSIDFREGKEVGKDELLFRIDARPYEENLRQAQANLASQSAQLERLRYDLTRARELISTSAISRADLDLAVANFTSGQAQLQALEAAVARAELDLEFTEIRSPIQGRTSRALVTPGNLVVADSTVLTNVVSLNPIYAYFDVDEGSALDYRQRVRESQADNARDVGVTVDIALGLSNETGHPHLGQIDFVDNVTDVGTGNISVRGRFDNPDGALLPGLFARVRVPFTRDYDALLIPQTALAMNQQGRYVLVVGQDNTATPHMVKVGTNHGPMVAILDGIGADDLVITKGLQKVRPGTKVSVEPDGDAAQQAGASGQVNNQQAAASQSNTAQSNTAQGNTAQGKDNRQSPAGGATSAAKGPGTEAATATTTGSRPKLESEPGGAAVNR